LDVYEVSTISANQIIHYSVNLYSEMVLGDKHYKHTDEGPCRSSRRTRSPSAAVLANAAAAATSSGTTSTDDADGMFCGIFNTRDHLSYPWVSWRITDLYLVLYLVWPQLQSLHR